MSLQTLHPTAFDEGVVLDQTLPPGIEVPECCDYSGLLRILEPLGAEMLVKALRSRLYLPPYRGVDWTQDPVGGAVEPRSAPKIQTFHRLLSFQSQDSSQIVRMTRAFQSTWTYAAVATQAPESERKRIIFSGPLSCLGSGTMDSRLDGCVPGLQAGLPYKPYSSAAPKDESTDLPLFINTIDGNTIVVPSMKVEGGSEMPAFKAALKHKLLREPFVLKSQTITAFHDILSSHL
jgi:methionyl-tRNA formyltransferase